MRRRQSKYRFTGVTYNPPKRRFTKQDLDNAPSEGKLIFMLRHNRSRERVVWKNGQKIRQITEYPSSFDPDVLRRPRFEPLKLPQNESEAIPPREPMSEAEENAYYDSIILKTLAQWMLEDKAKGILEEYDDDDPFDLSATIPGENYGLAEGDSSSNAIGVQGKLDNGVLAEGSPCDDEGTRLEEKIANNKKKQTSMVKSKKTVALSIERFIRRKMAALCI